MEYKYRYIKPLSEGEISSLEYGYKNGKQHYFRVKCKSMLMSHEGKKLAEIAAYAQKTPRTIRKWMNGYESQGIESFVVGKGRGVKAVMDEFSGDQEQVVKAVLKQHYQNLKTASAVLSKQLGIEVTHWMVRRFVKKNSITLGAECERASKRVEMR